FYQDPAYDRWSRSFAGFRKVISRVGDEVGQTATSYWFGPCQNNRLNASLPSAPSVPLCPNGSDDDPYASLSGQAVRVDRGKLGLFPTGIEWRGHSRPLRNEGGPAEYLWTRIYSYASPSTLFTRDDRHVTFSYPTKIDTYLYDDTKPVKSGQRYTTIA